MPECVACSVPMTMRFPGKVSNHWSCPKCGLERISPQPDDSTLAAIYDASYFSHYRSEIDPCIVRAMKHATYKHQLRQLPSPAYFGGQRRLLDCGAATGFLVELAKDLGWDAFAIEISEFGSRSCAHLLGPERVYRGQVQEASFAANPDGRFEVITMFDFIEHVRDPKGLLKWAKQQLSPGGALLLTTPRVGSISWRVMRRHWFHYTDEHLWFFTAKSIRMLLDESGFSAVEVRPVRKAIIIDYALAHYARSVTYNRLFSPLAHALTSILPMIVKRQRVWCYLGEMAAFARA